MQMPVLNGRQTVLSTSVVILTFSPIPCCYHNFLPFRFDKKLNFLDANHAKVKDAEVLLTGRDDGIQLCVKDDGVGFEPAGIHGKEGLGLASMEERVRFIQGEFSIQSEPGQGTAIKLWAPLSRRTE